MFKFYVAGVKFHNLKECIDEVQVGDVLSMIPEPTNKYDSNAVRLEFNSIKQDREIMIGYVPAKFSGSVTASIITSDLPLACFVTKIDKIQPTHQQLEVEIKEVKDIDYIPGDDYSDEEDDLNV